MNNDFNFPSVDPFTPGPIPGGNLNAPSARSKGFAITSLVLGILSLVCCCTVYLPPVLGVLAIVFGILSRSGNPKRMSAMAIVGIILGVIGMVVSIAIIAFAFWIVTLSADEMIAIFGQEFYDAFWEAYNESLNGTTAGMILSRFFF